MGDGDGGAASNGDTGEDDGVLLHVDDGGTGQSNRRRSRRSAGARECDATKVGEGHQGAAFLEVLNDPFGILSSKGSL